MSATIERSTTCDKPATATRRGPLRYLAHAVGYSVTLTPRALRDAVRCDERTISARRVTHSILGVLLGLVGLIELGLYTLFVMRGLLYGVVDDGPYTDAWGGPTEAGAWAAHIGVAFGAVLVALAVAVIVTGLHKRLTRWSHGECVASWVVPASVTLSAVAAVFTVFWAHQI